MKKRNIILASILAMSVFASGCSKKAESNVDNDKLTVYTTVFPVYDFVRNIGQDKVNLNYIIPPGVEPHDYEITPKVLKDIQNADLLIKNGLGIDNFVDKIESESDLKIVTASEGITPLTYSEEEEHDHEHDHDHDHEEEISDEHNHGEYDPHVWLDIDLAIKECTNIKDALIESDEENKEYYEENYNNYIKELENLNTKYNKELKNITKNDIIVSHDAYGYLCEKYDINQISITGISANQEPSLSKISEISNYVKDNNIKYILFDGLVNPKVSQTIANEANVDTAILYSIDGLTKKDFDNNASYVSLMEKNLETLKLVLK